MKKTDYINTTGWFYGNEVSEYGKKEGYIDYRCLAKAFDAVLANDIITETNYIVGEWEVVNGYENDEDYDKEIFQYFIIDENGADILQEYTDEIVFYNDRLNMYVWGVTHWGTAWDYVLTDIPCRIEKEA